MRNAWSIAGRAGPVDREDDLLAKAAASDPAAFAVIFELHRAAVFRYLRSRTISDDEAAELSAVTFERALGSISQFRASGGGLGPWLVRIARNAHLDAVRRGDRHSSVPGPEGDGPSSGHVGGLEDAVVLRSLVDALPAGQRDAIQLRFAAGLTAREIGLVLGLTEAAAQKQVERGLRALREAFHE